MSNSCTDIIQLKLKNEKPQIVIEAILDASNGTCTVNITKTVGFYSDSLPPKISGATITLNDSIKTYNLHETTAGLYFAKNINAKTGEKFNIKIKIDTSTYTASAIVPGKAPHFILLATKFNTPNPAMNGDIQVVASWLDQKNIANYYYLKVFVNNKALNNIYSLRDDQRLDGDTLKLPIMTKFTKGQKVTVQLWSMDKDMYQFYYQLSTMQGFRGSSTTPYNPHGNFKDQCLGYFGIIYKTQNEKQL